MNSKKKIEVNTFLGNGPSTIKLVFRPTCYNKTHTHTHTHTLDVY